MFFLSSRLAQHRTLIKYVVCGNRYTEMKKVTYIMSTLYDEIWTVTYYKKDKDWYAEKGLTQIVSELYSHSFYFRG